MDLKLKDVADLLNVSETTVESWLSTGKIPSYKIKEQLRFSRVEIENWVLNQHMPLPSSEKKIQKVKENPQIEEQEEIEKEEDFQKRGIKQFSLFRAIHKGDVISEVEGDSKEELIKTATKLITEKLELDADVISDLLLDREKLQPTALNNGIGIPHPRDFLLNTPHDIVNVIFPKKPIEYGAMDGKNVTTLFFLFACHDKNHLHLLAKIAHFCSSKETLDLLNSKPSKKVLLDYVKNWESKVGSC